MKQNPAYRAPHHALAVGGGLLKRLARSLLAGAPKAPNMHAVLAALLLAVTLVPAATRAENGVQSSQQTHPVVVELFTSQGCSSCPPADALIAELAGRKDIIALALHVDYWDYIGWKDVFAQPAFTDRQRGYARAAGHRTIYTPQIIVQGFDHVVGYKPMALADLLVRHHTRAVQAPVSLEAERQGDRLAISMAALRGASAALPTKIHVQVVRFTPLERVEIHRGENAGKTVDYANIVTSWETVDIWNGRGSNAVSVTLPSSDPVAVIVQSDLNGGPGPVLAAVRVD